jgi:eukaryotic-like serine/threonine-protein kinase
MAVRRFLVAGRYRLHEPVGTGGMGRVWMARDEMLDRDVAVKEFVPPEWMSDAEKARLRDRTLREARSAARLNHPHVVRIYDVVHADDLPWIVMEYVPSRSLHQVINEEGPLAPTAVARIGLDVLSALTAAHRAGVLHRDVKPHNVLIGTDGRVVLTDFGLATFVDDGAVTGPGLIVGSPQYVSPERARDGASTVESDLWSLGATLYAAVEGRSPYARESAMATLMALATEEPDPPVLAGPLAPVLVGLLRHEPTERLTANEVDERLRAIITPAPAHGRVSVRRPVVPVPRRPADDVPAEPEKLAVATAMAPPALRPASQASRASAPQPEISMPVGPISAPPSKTGPHRRRLWPILAGALVVVLLAGGAVVANRMVQRRDDNNRQQAGPAAPLVASTAAPAGTGFTPVGCEKPPAANLPRTPQKGASTGAKGFKLLNSWHEYVDVTGFRIGVPDGWTYERIGTTVCFRDPDNVRFLSVDPARNPAGNPIKACTTEANRLIAAGAMPEYELISLESASMQSTAADWEYTWTGPAGVRMHAKTRWLKGGTHAYAVSWATRDFDWQINTAYYGAALSYFTPIG